MSAVKVTTTFQGSVDSPESGHELAKELEARLHEFFTQSLPNLRNARHINRANVTFSMEIEGRRITVSRSETENRIERDQ